MLLLSIWFLTRNVKYLTKIYVPDVTKGDLVKRNQDTVDTLPRLWAPVHFSYSLYPKTPNSVTEKLVTHVHTHNPPPPVHIHVNYLTLLSYCRPNQMFPSLPVKGLSRPLSQDDSRPSTMLSKTISNPTYGHEIFTVKCQ